MSCWFCLYNLQNLGEQAVNVDSQSRPDSYHCIKAFGHCFDSGIVLLATRKVNGVEDQNYLAVRKYSLENCHKDIGLFLKVCLSLHFLILLNITGLYIHLTGNMADEAS